MKRFLLKLSLFAGPILLLTALPLAVLQLSGEFTPIAKVARKQAKATKQLRLGRAYSYRAPLYKFTCANLRGADVLVLGTSRTMEIRSHLFRSDLTFYNAGGGVRRIKHFLHFLTRMKPEALPDYLIVSLDHDFFNANFDFLDVDKDYVDAFSNDLDPLNLLKTTWPKIYADYGAGKFTLGPILRGPFTPHYGVDAEVNGGGFRVDGSNDYRLFISTGGNNSPDYHDYHFEETLDKIEKGLKRFAPGKEINPNALEELVQILEFCKQHDIYLSAYLPPYAHVIWEKMSGDQERYAYLTDLPETIARTLKPYGFHVHDFSDIQWHGGSDDEAIGGFHAGEKYHVRMHLQMMASDPVIREISADRSYLEEMLAKSPNSYDVFGPDVRPGWPKTPKTPERH